MNLNLLTNIITYDESLGLFFWNKRPESMFSCNREYLRWNNRYSGKKAGTKDSRGYIVIKFQQKKIKAHRLAYLLKHGSMPLAIDHIDGNKENNRIQNLREATASENNKNSSLRKDNNSGIPGVTWDKANSKWRCYIRVDKHLKHLGLCADFFEACCRRKAKELAYDFHANHGKA